MNLPSASVLANELNSKLVSNCAGTVAYWQEQWLAYMRENKRRFGSFADNSVGSLWGTLRNQPAICAGAGPSLIRNMHEFWRIREQGMCFISALHNLKTFEDRGIKPSYYVTLDASPVVVTDMFAHGRKLKEEYVEATKDLTLLAYVGTHPSVFDHWKGKVLFFNTYYGIPSYDDKAAEIEPFYTHINTGSNVLGACFYIAKAIMGANPIAFVGADFAYSPDGRFYANPQELCVSEPDSILKKNIYGNPVRTNSTYWGMKLFFDFVCSTTDGVFVNCTEGGILGAYDNGVMPQIPAVRLSDFLSMYRIHERTYSQCIDPTRKNESVAF